METKKSIEEAFGGWIETTKGEISKCELPEGNKFKEDYLDLLKTASNQTGRVADSLSKLVEDTLKGRKKPAEVFKDYYDAFSIQRNTEEPEEEKTFLPSHSDKCLIEMVKTYGCEPSPFRGIYYSWVLGEIYSDFESYRDCSNLLRKSVLLKRATNKLQSVSDLAKTDSDMQSSSQYQKYLRHITPEYIDQNTIQDIIGIKTAFKDVIFNTKFNWIKDFAYPSKTSTHFYLSGLRFYHFPFLYGPENLNNEEHKLYVHSTDSGIYQPTEHYGMALDFDDPFVIQEMICKLPPGCLRLDLLDNKNVTSEDKKSLRYFEAWSKILTDKTHKIVSETLNLLEDNRVEEAIGLFANQVKKNPMRKFYFDTGIYQAALRARKGGGPQIEYLTTEKSLVRSEIKDHARSILSHFLETGGINYRILKESKKDGWGDQFSLLSALTLIPSENLSPFSNAVISIRDSEAKKISHGLCLLGRIVQDKMNALILNAPQMGLDFIGIIAQAMGAQSDSEKVVSILVYSAISACSGLNQALSNEGEKRNKSILDSRNTRSSQEVNLSNLSQVL